MRRSGIAVQPGPATSRSGLRRSRGSSCLWRKSLSRTSPAAFDDRASEPDLPFEGVVKELRKRGKL